MRVLCILPALVFGGAAAACDGRTVDGPGVIAAPVCVPTSPERIVVLDPTYSLGMALELGLPVVGAPLFGMSDAALKAKAIEAGVTDLGAFTEPSIETIVALQPDLILGSGMLGETAYRILSRIAPTVLVTLEDWKAYETKLAEATGREAAAAALLAEYEARAAGIAERMPKDVTVSSVRITPWDFQVYLDAPAAYAPFAILADVGVERPPWETSEGGETVKRPDWEELGQLTGDVLLYIVGGANDSATSGRHEEVLANPLWQMLPAVRSGNVHRVDVGTWMEFSGVASAHRVLNDIERILIDG
nr:ABC transporter substrate-binding protein [Acuticoccus kalidii]